MGEFLPWLSNRAALASAAVVIAALAAVMAAMVWGHLGDASDSGWGVFHETDSSISTEVLTTRSGELDLSHEATLRSHERGVRGFYGTPIPAGTTLRFTFEAAAPMEVELTIRTREAGPTASTSTARCANGAVDNRTQPAGLANMSVQESADGCDIVATLNHAARAPGSWEIEWVASLPLGDGAHARSIAIRIAEV